MTFITTEPGVLKRVDIKELESVTSSAPTIVTEMIDFLDGNDRHYIELKMAERFATRIVDYENDAGETVSKIARTVEAKKAAIEFGLLEVSLLYLYNRIVRESNILSRGESFSYQNEPADYPEDIKEARKRGNRLLKMTRVDELSIATGSSAVLVQVLGNKLNYQIVGRDSIWVCFADTIFENDEERPVDKLEFEEASAVIVQLSAGQYVAYFGRSEVYPQGRQVKYKADNWYSVPDVNSEESQDAIEYLDDAGEIANPLTLWSNTQANGLGIPEYPIAAWLGSTKGYGKSILPVDYSLYKQTKELDLATSRVLMSTLKSARGVFALTKAEGASNKIPETYDEGTTILEQGLSLATHSIPGINANYSNAIIANLAAHTSEAWRVPAYRLAINDSTTIPSGVALIELNKPLMEMHQERAEKNRENVNRIFHIENALASLNNGQQQGEDIIEYWEPHQIDLRLSEKERIENAVAKKNAGIMDVNHVAEEILPNINSYEEAQKWIEELEIAQVEEAPARGVNRFR